MDLFRLAASMLAVLALQPISSAAAELAETLTIRLGHVFPATHFEHQGYLRMAEEAAERSNGKIIIQVFPQNELGSEREQLEQMKIGALEMMSGGGAIQNYAPETGVWALPFIFHS
ncbi:MAG: TRAP transporter substrate-binding protein DctP, partial [Candidatus Hydrogenedentales bacterium]